MSEEQAALPDGTTRCPWCSTETPAGTEICPSCGAALIATADTGLPGVTAIDAEAVLRSGRGSTRSRGGLLGFLSGETGSTVDAPSAAELSSLAPPNTNVRIEMMRLELDAERQRLEGEAAGLAADAVVDGEIPAIPAGVVTPDQGAPGDWDQAAGTNVAEEGAAGAQASAPPSTQPRP